MLRSKMEIPDILKIGGLDRYASKGIENLTTEEPPLSEWDIKFTRGLSNYFPILCESWRDMVLVAGVLVGLNSDSLPEKVIFTGAQIPIYILGSYVFKYVIDESLNNLRTKRQKENR